MTLSEDMHATGVKLCYLKTLVWHPTTRAWQWIFVNVSHTGSKMLLNITFFNPHFSSQQGSLLAGFYQVGRVKSLLNNNFSYYFAFTTQRLETHTSALGCQHHGARCDILGHPWGLVEI